MRIKYLGFTDKGRNLIHGSEYEVRSIYGPLIGIIDESGESYYYPNSEGLFEVIDPDPAPLIKEYKPMTLEEAREKFPEYFVQ